MAWIHGLRNTWVLSLLDVKPDDRVLEIGFGPGTEIQRVSNPENPRPVVDNLNVNLLRGYGENERNALATVEHDNLSPVAIGPQP